MQLYIHREGQQLGPYSTEEVAGLVASGSVSADDLAWHEGAADWAPLGQVLDGLTSPPTAPAPTPAAQADWIPARRSNTPAPVSTHVRDAAAANESPVRAIPLAATRVATPALASQPFPLAAPQSVPQAALLVAPTGKPQAAAAPVVAKRPTGRSSSGMGGPTKRSIGVRNMLIGGLFCGGGTAVTVISYEAAASSPHGGSYILAGGAIVFGGLQFLRGLIQFIKS